MNFTNALDLILSRCIIVVLAISISLLQITMVWGDQPPISSSARMPTMPEDFQPPTAPNNNPNTSPRNFNRYVKDKYKQINRAESDVKQTAHGPSGMVFIVGDIAPQKKPAIDLTTEPDRHVRARAIANTFMEDETALFGIIRPDEIREVSIQTTKGYDGNHTNIHYKRYINEVELEDANWLISIGPSESISSVLAWLVSVPPEVYEATNKKTLSDKEIQAIIDTDLAEQVKRGLDMNNINKSFKKVAISKYPYVLWKVTYVYDYTIDAFTGKILAKDSGILPPFKKTQQPRIETPLPPEIKH